MDQPLFRFAVMADTHVNEAEDGSNSPWQSNRRANARTRYAVARINADRPDFVIHLGDMVHPVPGVPTYSTAAEQFTTIVNDLHAPLHLVPGNHDIGEKPVNWAPADPVSNSSLGLYERTFGAAYYSFDHADCHFVVINTMVMNSDLQVDQVQRQWLERDLASHRQQRTFIFGHYPLYLAQADEPEYYDNIAEPGRSWLLRLFEQFGVEAYFAGHVHNFFYNRHETTDCYLLPSTSFVRHDYAELSRIEPAPEYGRDDRDKLGYMIIDVHPDTHIPHVVRTHGQTNSTDVIAPVLPYLHPRHGGSAPVGFDMRQPFAEIVEVPYNGLLDEFTRRAVRNDYPLLALWELGAGTMRIPITDLINSMTAQRIHELAAVGHDFCVFSYDIPTGKPRKAITDHAAHVSRIEIILPESAIELRRAEIARLRADTQVPIHLSPLSTSAYTAHASQAQTRFAHYIRHGYDIADGATITTTSGVDGIVFRVSPDRSPWHEIKAADQLASSLRVAASVHVTLAGDDPAAEPTDDIATANRVAETLAAAWCAGRTHVFLDTIADVDRGYYPRRGLTDRHHNPRLAGTVYRNLHAALQRLGPGYTRGRSIDLPGASAYSFDRKTDTLVLILPHSEFRLEELKILSPIVGDVLDLASARLTKDSDLSAHTCTTPTILNIKGVRGTVLSTV